MHKSLHGIVGALACRWLKPWVLNRFLHEHKSLLGALANMTAQQLGWSGRPVVSVTPDTCAMVACSLMAEKNIAGIGVVSQSGALIGNFSYSDLRCRPVFPPTHQELFRVSVPVSINL